jgi:hypothetical protein
VWWWRGGLTLETYRPGEPDGKGQTRGQAGLARGELPYSATTAAEPALQILEGRTMLRSPCLKVRGINRIG